MNRKLSQNQYNNNVVFIGPCSLLSALGPWLAGLGPLAALAPLGTANGPRPANHDPWADNKPLGPSKPHYCYIVIRE